MMKWFQFWKWKQQMQNSRREKLANLPVEIMAQGKYKDLHANALTDLSYNINPFIDVAKRHQEVQYIDDISISVPKIFVNYYPIKIVLANQRISKKRKKQIIHDLLLKWEYDYYKEVDLELREVLERSSYNPVKRIKMIHQRTINSYIFFVIFLLVLLRQFSGLQLIPFIGTFFRYTNTLLIYRRFYRLTIILGYLSIIIAIYMVIVKVYFSKVLKYGLSAKGFLIKERDRMLKKLNPTKRRIKKHLYQLMRKKAISPYPIKQIYNSKVVINRIKSYGYTVIDRVGFFTMYYKMLILIAKVMQLAHLILLIYLTYYFMTINQIF